MVAEGARHRLVRLSYRMVKLAALLSTVGGFALPSLGAHAATDPLWITYFDCPENLYGYSQPRLIVSHLNGPYIVQRSWPRTNAVAQRTLNVSLPPGFYNVFVGNGTCSDDVPVTLLPGHERHIVALGRAELWLDRRPTMVSGTLPSLGWQVAIVYRDRPRNFALPSSSRDGYLQYPAQVEGDAYYAVKLPDGKFTVRLYNEWTLTWLDFDGGEIEYAKGQRVVVRNIAQKDVSAKLYYLAHTPPTCVTEKSGVKVCTPPD
jgi:hypothetical protein